MKRSDGPAEQPTPNVSQSDVDRVIARDFEPDTHDRIRMLVADCDPALSPRVILAVLKLSNGEAGAIPDNLETARRDWRDVVAYAEYPAYMEATSGGARLGADRRSEVIGADWQQYESWLRR